MGKEDKVSVFLECLGREKKWVIDVVWRDLDFLLKQ